MTTTAITPAVDTGALTTEKQTYRAYITTTTDKDGKTIVDKIKAQAEAQAKNKDGVAVNWAKLENEKDKEGNPVWTLFNENEFVRYTVKSDEGFKTLVPDETQRNYVIQCGLNYIMNAKANGAMTAMVDGAPEPTPLFNQQTIDLRTGVGPDGEYSINEAPSRKAMSEMDKLMAQLERMGVPPEKRAAIALALAATKEEEATEEVEA